MLFRPQSFAAVFILVSIIYASSQDVISKLSSNSELSSFTSMVKNSTALQKALNSTHDFTLLAPSNAALAAAANHTASLNQNQTDALLVYHLLNSTVPFASFQTKPKFIPTFLTSSEYSNVTEGQVVELVLGSDGNPQAISFNTTASQVVKSDIVVNGGLVHIIDTVLTIPEDDITLATDAGLSYLIAILSNGFYFSTVDSGFGSEMDSLPVVTYFVPNSQAAVTQFDDMNGPNLPVKEAESLFKYHVVQGQVVYSSDFETGLQLQTLQGTNLTITVEDDGTKYANGAKILATDYLVSNGVLHTLENLLDPNNRTSPPTQSATPSNSSATLSPTSSADSKTTSDGLSAGAKAGIAIAVVVVVLGALGIGLFVWRSRNKAHTAMRIQETDTSTPPPYEPKDAAMGLHTPFTDKPEMSGNFEPSELHNEARKDDIYEMSPIGDGSPVQRPRSIRAELSG